MGMIRDKGSVLQGIALEAVRHGADTIEVEYKDGNEQVFAVRGGVGYGIARLDSSSDQAASLREELYSLMGKRRRVTIGDVEYELRVRVYECFGEDAFQVELRRI
jgi:hypothetical protein